jgi:acetoin utilization deacetylase AcuC-like enzyme
MGFCPVNHVAVVARHLQATGAAARVAIVDWDVHHGNGTQDIFYEDPSVFFLSLHQWPFYPGTGARDERGSGEGSGMTLNVPIPAGTSRGDYEAAFLHALEEVERCFEPDFILVSAGFDALAGDPIGGLLLEPEDFHGFARAVSSWAARACGGRVLALLEGGYEPVRTGAAGAATLAALAGSDWSGEK